MTCLRTPPRPVRAALTLGLALLLGGCEQLGIETPETVAAARDADGRAIGAACRHAGRAIEDCYRLYGKVERAAVFAGWREMNDYMREHGIDAVAPKLAGQADPEAENEVDSAADARPAGKKMARAESR